MEVPGTVRLRPTRRDQAFRVSGREDHVVEVRRGVDDSADRWQVPAGSRQNAGHQVTPGHVGLLDTDVETPVGQVGHHLLGLGGSYAAPADEHQVAGATISEPPGHREPQATEAAGDHIGGVGPGR
jgi:hypothetical protein